MFTCVHLAPSPSASAASPEAKTSAPASGAAAKPAPAQGQKKTDGASNSDPNPKPFKPCETQGSIVIVGQKVVDSSGRELILFDPNNQPYKVLYADRENYELTEYSKTENPALK